MKTTKFLLAATTLLVAGSAISHGITVDIEKVRFETSEDYNLNGVVYTASTGIVSGLDHANLMFDMTLGWTTAGNIIYVENVHDTVNQWGFYSTEDGGITGNWNLSSWTNGGSVTSDTLSSYANDNIVTVTASINSSGTYMYAGAEEAQIYGASGLKSTNGTLSDSITINKDIVSAIYYNGQVTISNAAASWSKTYDPADVTLQTSGAKKEIKSSTIPTGTIVVGGNSQIFLQTWGNGGNLDLSNDIVLGATTYSEGSYSNVGIRFGNDGSNFVTTLTGNLYVVEDAAIKSGGTNAVNINGTVTDKVENDNGEIVDTGSMLSVTGSGISFGGVVDMTGITLNSGVTFSGATTTIGSLNVAGGETTISGVATIGNLSISSGAKVNISGETTITENLGGALSVMTGGTLVVANGSNLSEGSVSVADGATLKVAVSETTVSAITLVQGATLAVDLSGFPSEASDGDATALKVLINSSTITFGDEALTAGATLSSDLNGYFDETSLGDYAKYAHEWAYDGSTLSLTITIPEPSAFGLLAGVGALALVVARRKRRK